MAENPTDVRLSWPRRLPVWVLPLVILVVQVGIGLLTHVHLPAGHGPPWVQGQGPPWWHGGQSAAVTPAPEPPSRAVDLLGYGLLVLGPVAMGFRRWHRAGAFLGVFAADCVFFALGYPIGPAIPSLIVTLFVAVLNGPRLLAWLLFPVAYVLIEWSAPIFGRGAGPSVSQGIALIAWPLAVLALGEVVRLTRDRIAQNQRARAEAERRRQEEARRRAADERLRIAQELHDVLAHHISMINVQASTALHLLDDQPERARPSLSAIKDASKEALVELRSALDVLRQSGERAPRAPTTGLDQLDGLVDRTRAAGLAVDMSIEGERRALPPGVDLAAFRIVQEALTNVVRHADARRVTVRIGYRADELDVEVVDDGTGPAGTDAGAVGGPGADGRASADTGDRPAGADGRFGADGPDGAGGANVAHGSPDGDGVGGIGDGTGNGIVGMRERAAALGGELSAGTRPGGGFRVRARLPFSDGREPA